ncbi:MAG: hypothetical protein LBK66_15165 [Spirochaetaceae bacterium]|jgi:hypothetical protein|nr:hypothetical protein [Spirochaetaceae bacterium]
MSDFKLTKDKLPDIAKELGVDISKVVDLLPRFTEFYEDVRQQHLASVMRALELRVRRKRDDPNFRIIWGTMTRGTTSTKDAVALLYRKLSLFAIAVPPEMNLQQLRNHVAHELGHLFYDTEHPEDKNDKQLNQKMANVFGVFTMLERGDFYKEKAPKMCNSTWYQVINDFKQLSNREDGKLGTS